MWTVCALEAVWCVFAAVQVTCPQGSYCTGNTADAVLCTAAAGSYCPAGSSVTTGVRSAFVCVSCVSWLEARVGGVCVVSLVDSVGVLCGSMCRLRAR